MVVALCCCSLFSVLRVARNIRRRGEVSASPAGGSTRCTACAIRPFMSIAIFDCTAVGYSHALIKRRVFEIVLENLLPRMGTWTLGGRAARWRPAKWNAGSSSISSTTATFVKSSSVGGPFSYVSVAFGRATSEAVVGTLGEGFV